VGSGQAGYAERVYDVGAIIEEPRLLDPLRESVRAGRAPRYLRSLKVKLTARCNLGCVMCRYGRGDQLPELPTDRWRELLGQAAGLGCRKVHFSGGEILMRRDLEDLVAEAASRRMKVTLSTNLTLLTKERAKRLFAQRVSGVSTSLDGARARTHDELRGAPGCFRRTLEALGYLERYRVAGRPKVRVNFVMTRHNFRQYPELVRLAAEYGAIDVVPMPVDSKRTELRLSKRLIAEYNFEVAPRVRHEREAAGMPIADGYVHPFGRTRAEIQESGEGQYAIGFYRSHLCYAPFLHAFIAWDGLVYPCCMTNGRIPALGDLKRVSLGDVFGGESYQSLRRSMLEKRLPSCDACDMFIDENRLLGAALEGTSA
jgi:MoaA/NifB/PqqE/SkfB family radical SAM enzyme